MSNVHNADIALLDIDMPGMGGMELAKAIKDKDPDVSIIYNTEAYLSNIIY